MGASQGNLAVAFFKPNSLVGRLICLRTGRPYSHVELVRLEQRIMTDRGKQLYLCYSSYEGDGGVRVKFIGAENFAHLEFIYAEPAALQTMWLWFEGKIGRKYDWAGVIGFCWPWSREDDQRWFCSEICATALKLVMPALGGLVPGKVSPSALASLLAKERLRAEVG